MFVIDCCCLTGFGCLHHRILELYEPMLCEITTIDGRDESRTIAQMLATLNGNETSSPKKSSIN